jgi:hypothetical protein
MYYFIDDTIANRCEDHDDEDPLAPYLHHVAPEDSLEPNILNFAASKMSLATFAACTLGEVVLYFDSNFINNEAMDITNIPISAFTRHNTKLTHAQHFERISDAHQYLSTLFTSGMSADVLECIADTARQSLYSWRIHPDDAQVFLKKVNPRRYSTITPVDAAQLLWDMYCFSHLRSFVCSSYLAHNFPGIWL